MNQSQPHRATLEQWCYLRQYLRLNRQTPDHIAAANASITLELAARIEALEATQHAHVDLSHLSDAEREQVAQELAKPAAWRPLEVETTYGSEPASDEPISMATAQQILSPRMVEGTFEHGGETYRYKATPIATDQELRRAWGSVTGEDWNTALRAVYDLGRQHGSAQATCPHIVSSDEGTSYCRLAEQSATPATPMTELRAASAKARSGGLLPVEYVDANGDGIRIIMEPAEETGQACWVVRNSRRVSPFQEFRTPEAAYAAHQARAEQAPEPVTPMDELRSASAEARPGGLVERVALALDSDCPQDEYVIKDCRAVIREVAAALLEWHDSDQIVHTAWEAAKWLQQEADRG